MIGRRRGRGFRRRAPVPQSVPGEQTITLTNLQTTNLSGEAVPFIMPMLYGWDEFSASTDHLEYTSTGGTAAVSTCGRRTDREGSTRMIIAAGVVTPTTFAQNDSVPLTAAVTAGAEPTQTNVPTWTQLLAADSEFDFTFSCNLDGSPFSTSLRDDSTAYSTYLEGTNCGAYIRRSPLLDSHRWVEWHVYIFKSDSNALTAGNLVDVAVDVMMCCGGINDATIARKTVTSLDVTKGVTTPTSVYTQGTTFTWQIHDVQKIPISRGPYHASFWWNGVGDQIMVKPPTESGKWQRIIDTAHSPNFINTGVNWSTYTGAEERFTNNGATPFTNPGLDDTFNYEQTSEHPALGPFPEFGVALIGDPSADKIKWNIYDSEMCRGLNNTMFVNDSGTMRFPNAFTTETFLPATMVNRVDHTGDANCFTVDRAHMRTRNHLAFMLTGRYSHFYQSLCISQLGWQLATGDSLEYFKRLIIGYSDSNNRNGRMLGQVASARACMLDNFDGTGVGTADWGTTTMNQWLDATGGNTETQTAFSTYIQMGYNYTLQNANTPNYLSLRYDQHPWMWGLSSQNVAMAYEYRVFDPTLGAFFVDHHAKYYHQLSTLKGGFISALGPFNKLGNPNEYSPPSTPLARAVLDADRLHQRWLQNQHNSTVAVYPVRTGVNATIDITGAPSVVVITFDSNIFAGVSATEYEDVWATGRGYILWINPTREAAPNGEILTHQGSGMISQINADNQCTIDCSVGNFMLPADSYPTSFATPSVGTWSNVEVPLPMDQWPSVPVAPDPLQRFEADFYSTLTIGGAMSIFEAAENKPVGMATAVAWYESLMTNSVGRSIGATTDPVYAKYETGLRS